MNHYLLAPAALVVAVLSVLFSSKMGWAGQITLADFSSGAVVENFEGFGTGLVLATPVIVAGNIYNASGNRLARSSKLGPVIGRSGVAIANGALTGIGPPPFIDITLSNPALRAGMYVGGEFPWSADIQFFGMGNSLLGIIQLSGNGKDSQLAAWQADSESIGRIRATSTISDPTRFIIVDDLIVEVPESTNIIVLAIGALAAGWRLGRV